jgi:hypothetical protein
MPDPIVCPHCREELDIPAEYHGRQVRCANCQNVFVATPAGDMPVVHRLPGRSSRGDDRPPWQDDDRARRARRDDEQYGPPRRSNAGVWLLMALTLLTVGVCCGGLNLVTFIAFNPALTPHTSAEGKFKVDFPGENPTGGPIAGDGGNGWQVTARRPMAQERYTVRCYDLKAEWRKLSEADALEKVMAEELAGLGAGAAAEGPDNRRERTKHNGFTALDAMATSGAAPNQTVTLMRCILAGKRVYVVSVQGQNTHPQFWWVRQYFLSFEITDPSAKPPEKEE